MHAFFLYKSFIYTEKGQLKGKDVDYTWEKGQGLTMVFPLYYKTRVS